MTQIKPFCAYYYNTKKIKDLNKVICPPYDVISAEEQQAYHKSDPNNFIHLLLGLDKPGDHGRENKYARSKKMFAEWIKDDVFVQDEQPCLYIYKQEYKIQGQKKVRVGFLGLMKIQDKEKSKVFPHENTHLAAKQDRLRLIRHVKANLCPIFVCYADRYHKSDKIFHNYIASHPEFLHVVDQEGVRHQVWRLQDRQLIEKIKALMDDQALFIADGHHRYEVALEYRRLQMQKAKKNTGNEPYHYIMTYFTNLDSKELAILPIHRVVRKFPVEKIDFLEKFFRIDKIKTVHQLRMLLGKAGQNEHAFGLYIRGSIKLLRLKNRLLIDEYMKEGSLDFRRLDAAILKNFVFDRLHIATDEILYYKDLDRAIDMVDEKKAEACFLMNPVRVDQLKAVALNGEKMPPKTTYFYPKVLSGLTIHNMQSSR